MEAVHDDDPATVALAVTEPAAAGARMAKSTMPRSVRTCAPGGTSWAPPVTARFTSVPSGNATPAASSSGPLVTRRVETPSAGAGEGSDAPSENPGAHDAPTQAPLEQLERHSATTFHDVPSHFCTAFPAQRSAPAAQPAGGGRHAPALHPSVQGNPVIQPEPSPRQISTAFEAALHLRVSGPQTSWAQAARPAARAVQPGAGHCCATAQPDPSGLQLSTAPLSAVQRVAPPAHTGITQAPFAQPAGHCVCEEKPEPAASHCTSTEPSQESWLGVQRCATHWPCPHAAPAAHG
jgi:hypothetical protein